MSEGTNFLVVDALHGLHDRIFQPAGPLKSVKAAYFDQPAELSQVRHDFGIQADNRFLLPFAIAIPGR
jgi:hypothetical protein